MRALRRRGLVASSAAALILVAAAAVAVPLVTSAPAHAEIDGIALRDDEVAIGVDRTGRAVEQAGGDAADVNAAAVDALRDDIALLQVARDLGVTDLERPGDILHLLDEVNDSRAEAQRAGEVIYGPVEYSARTFYSKALADVREAALVAMRSSTEPRSQVSDADVRARFDEEAGDWASAATTFTLTQVWTAETDRAAAATVLSTALAEGVATGARVETVVVTEDELSGGMWNPDTVDALRSAEVGTTTELEPAQAGWAVYRVDSRSTDAEAAFDHYRERIRDVLREERLDTAIADARAEQHLSD